MRSVYSILRQYLGTHGGGILRTRMPVFSISVGHEQVDVVDLGTHVEVRGRPEQEVYQGVVRALVEAGRSVGSAVA